MRAPVVLPWRGWALLNECVVRGAAGRVRCLVRGAECGVGSATARSLFLAKAYDFASCGVESATARSWFSRRRTKVRGAPLPPSILPDSVVTASSLPSWRSSWLSWPSLIPPFSGVGCASDRTASGLDRWPPGRRDRPARCLPLRDHLCASLAARLRVVNSMRTFVTCPETRWG